jgi:NADH:ubiquinone oxidoreductase subunit 6 (subunit J)
MELTLFVIVAAVALVAAAMMLISHNAIYSALFLILNFACIAFLFLMLNAPFLAMVQITVYAGAIMVLFLFVIMLLGAERVPVAEQPRFRWLAPVAVVLALVFMVTASAAIISGEIELTERRDVTPKVRVVHALDGVDAVDVYLDDILVADGIAFGDSTDFEEWEIGQHSVRVFTAGDDPFVVEPLTRRIVDINSGQTLSFVGVGRGQSRHLVVASEDMSSMEKTDDVRFVVINGLPERPLVDVWDDAGSRELLFEGLPYGEASASRQVSEDTFSIGLYPTGNDRNPLVVLKDAEFDGGQAVLLVFARRQLSDSSFEDVILSLETDAHPAFGGPTHVGQLLFSKYVLPFELVSLLLLVAMIGAIVLTHETLGAPRRVVRRLANPPAGLEQPITGQFGK